MLLPGRGRLGSWQPGMRGLVTGGALIGAVALMLVVGGELLLLPAP